MSVNGVEIQVGQVWEDSNGVRITVRKNDGHRMFPWVSQCRQNYRSDGGEYGGNGDLVRLVSGPTISITPAATVFDVQIVDMHVTGYHTLANVLQLAYNQAAVGKGAERHANSLPFHEQPMTTINRALGSIDGFVYQAHKKSLEAKRLPTVDRQVAELLGAINYLAGAVIALELGRGDK